MIQIKYVNQAYVVYVIPFFRSTNVYDKWHFVHMEANFPWRSDDLLLSQQIKMDAKMFLCSNVINIKKKTKDIDS